jgi:hypothetical protein
MAKTSAQDDSRTLRQALLACQAMFQARSHVARPLVDKLRKSDLDVIYRAVLPAYVLSKYSPEREQSRIHTADFARWGSVFSLLSDFLAARDVKERSVPKEGSTEEARGQAHFYAAGAVPNTRLRLGEYLYYRKVISREDLQNACEWQMQNRPMFGQVAIQEGVLSPSDFARVLARLGKNEFFGELAREMRVMSSEQVDRVLKAQNEYNLPIGTYFVEKKILSGQQLVSLLRDLKQHNKQISEGAARTTASPR